VELERAVLMVYCAEAITFAEDLISPTTLSAAEGDAVPMPTKPLPRITSEDRTTPSEPVIAKPIVPTGSTAVLSVFSNTRDLAETPKAELRKRIRNPSPVGTALTGSVLEKSSVDVVDGVWRNSMALVCIMVSRT
jgi:hypothetical protein